MENNGIFTLRQIPEWKERAAEWFHAKWGVPEAAYLACMDEYLDGKTAYGWYLCLDGDRIVGGLGVIANDFHDRKDLTPNICAVYTRTGSPRKGNCRQAAEYRRRGSVRQGHYAGLSDHRPHRLL